jgi:Ran GTPase-activating protein (RanGAP) involved in mRNA processing and transport
MIFKGLAKNTSVKSVYLKGNNISGNTVVLLGQLLRLNGSITRLSLEWNCVGLEQDCFAVLCAGLGSNKGLQVMDLRNNQLTHQAVIALSSALRFNCTLKHLGKWKFFQLIKTILHEIKLILFHNGLIKLMATNSH